MLTTEKGTIYAFEPVKKTFNSLKKTIEINSMTNVKSFCLALSNDSKLTVQNFNTTRGMLTKQNDSSDLEVSLVSFDSFFEGKKIKKIDGIKIDVDGPELDVLLGLEKLISKDKPKIIIEVHDQSFENANLVFHHEKK